MIILLKDSKIHFVFEIIFIILLSSCLQSHSQASGFDSTSSGCLAMNSGTKLDECHRKINRLVKKFLRFTRKKKVIDICHEMLEVDVCTHALERQCDDAMNDVMLQEWSRVSEVFHCSCSGDTECASTLNCFRVQYNSLLSKRCDDLLKFNIKQKTVDPCIFHQESYDCKLALVTSACGTTGVKLASDLFSLDTARRTQTKNQSCKLSKGPPYTGFHYNNNCPVNFVNQVRKCHITELSNAPLSFYSNHDLIAYGNENDVKVACRDFDTYSSCISKVNSTCPKGVREAYDYSPEARVYLLKMRHICREYQQGYAPSLLCYQQILLNETLQRCQSLWDSVRPQLRNMTSYTFYCMQHNNDVIKILSGLIDLRQCYEQLYYDHCSQTGGDVMASLMKEAFIDPFYLRFQYRPDCTLFSRRITSASQISSKNSIKNRTISSVKKEHQKSQGSRVLNNVHFLFLTICILNYLSRIILY